MIKAKQYGKDSFSVALKAMDDNRIDGPAAKALKRCSAVDRLYKVLEEAVDIWKDDIDNDADINGAAAVDWLVEFIGDARTAMKFADTGEEES